MHTLFAGRCSFITAGPSKRDCFQPYERTGKTGHNEALGLGACFDLKLLWAGLVLVNQFFFRNDDSSSRMSAT